jgi:uncharacterized protein DUF6709
METWVLKMIRTAALRRVIAWGVVLAGGVLLFVSNARYVGNFVRGPFALDRAALDSIGDVGAAQRYFVRVTPERAIDTDIREYTTHTNAGVETSREVTGAYYALVLGDRLLITKTDGEAPTVAEGSLEPLPADVESHLFDSKEMQAIRPRFYSFYVNNESFRLPGYIAIAVVLVLALLLVKIAAPAWRYYREPESHPLLQRIASWRVDPLGVAVEAERDFNTPRFKEGNGWRVGEKYLIRSAFFTFDLLRLTDLLWAYKKVTKHSVNFIPTGKTYDAILVCYGGSATIKAKEKRVEEMIRFAGERAPWAVIGYSAEVATLFAKDIRAFTAAVESRRRGATESAPGRSPSA